MSPCSAHRPHRRAAPLVAALVLLVSACVREADPSTPVVSVNVTDVSTPGGDFTPLPPTPDPRVTPVTSVTPVVAPVVGGTPGVSASPAPPFAVTVVTPGVSPTPTRSPYPWEDASAIMSGLCFESVWDAAGQLFVLRSAEEHIRFYALADNSGLCRQPVTRIPFDFSSGRILAGVWSRGAGCTARHDMVSWLKDDETKSLFIRLRLVTEGDCAYELVRPYWIAVENAADYEVQILVE